VSRARLLLPLVVALASCAEEKLVAEFTSEVVQLDSCRVVGDGPETCTRAEARSLLRVTLAEIDDDRVWLHGLPTGNQSDTSILGTKDREGGFLFLTEQVQENVETGCVLATSTQLSLAIEEDAAAVGEDPCTALLGREVETTRTSAECDDVRDPPESVVRITRRRWQKPAECLP
jgi:hypothetical protein